jgi:hypothetical protein
MEASFQHTGLGLVSSNSLNLSTQFNLFQPAVIVLPCIKEIVVMQSLSWSTRRKTE